MTLATLLLCTHMADVSYDGEKVVEINWDNRDLTGNLKLQHLPQSVKHFSASGNNLCGPLKLCNLPTELISMDLSDNKITQETVEIGLLPQSLEILDLTGNEIKHIVCESTQKPLDDPRVWF